MKKGLIIALAALLVLGLSSIAMAWTIDSLTYLDSNPATGERVSGRVDLSAGVTGCEPFCGGDFGVTLDYDLRSVGVIENINGQGVINIGGDDEKFGGQDIYGSGGPSVGAVTVNIYGPSPSWDVTADRIAAAQVLTAVVCQTDCCEVDKYVASSSANIEDGHGSMILHQGTGVPGPYTGYYQTSGQTLGVAGEAGYDIDDGLDAINGMPVAFDAHMTATQFVENDQGGFDLVETHTMGVYGENVEFNIDMYQGMTSTTSVVYGVLFPDPGCCDIDGVLWYGPWEGEK